MGPGSGAQPTLGAPAPGEDAYPGDDIYRTGPFAAPDGTGSSRRRTGPTPASRPAGSGGRRAVRGAGTAAGRPDEAPLPVPHLARRGRRGRGRRRVRQLQVPVRADGQRAGAPDAAAADDRARISPGFDKTLGKWQHIGTRAEDPEPLTITGLYPPQFVLNGSSYVRTAASVTKTCSLAVYGADLQAALQSGHCTQVLRASYISGDGKMMGTVGVVNLISSSAAQKAGQVTGPQEIIAPLSGKKGPTSKLGNGTGVVQAEIKGHYLILMWAEFANLKSPSGQAQRQTLEQFAANLVTGSANINLSTRMLTGKP